MKPLILIVSLLLISSMTNAGNSLFTEVLQNNVHDGKVNYPGLCKTPEFASYLEELSRIDPAKFADKNDELAFWINSYNAFTLKIICDHYPLKSINELHTGGYIIGHLIHETIWDKKIVPINGQQISLNTIEHEIIRKKFHEPRAHFALVCASKSCPSLRSEAYEGAKLNEQLDEQGKLFFANKKKNYFEVDQRVAHLSKILDWYSKDFGSSKAQVLSFVAHFLPPSTAAAIQANPDQWTIKYTDYDWSLNE